MRPSGGLEGFIKGENAKLREMLGLEAVSVVMKKVD